MKHNFLVPALCASMLALTVGCVNNFNEDDHIATQEGLMESVSFSDDLADQIRIIQTSRIKTESGVEVVCIRGRLKRDGFTSYVFNSAKAIDLSYRFVWFDKDGKEIAGNSGSWHTVALYPGEEFACTSYAPMKGVDKVKLEIKEGVEVSTVKEEKEEKIGGKVLKNELPAEIREGKTTTTKEIKAKNDEVEQKNKTIQKVNQKVEQKNKKNPCLCGCANGEPCYCPEGSACPNAGKYKKPAKK